MNKYINSVQEKLTVQVDRRFAKLKPCIIHFREFVKLYVREYTGFTVKLNVREYTGFTVKLNVREYTGFTVKLNVRRTQARDVLNLKSYY